MRDDLTYTVSTAFEPEMLDRRTLYVRSRVGPTLCKALLLGTLAGCNGGGGSGDGGTVMAAPDTFSVAIGANFVQPAPGVLANDTGGSLTAELVSGPANAVSFSLNPNGSFSYTHNGNGTSDSFTYRARNGTSSATATVTISITPPTANADSYTVNRGQPFSVGPPGVLANDLGGGLQAQIASSPSNASSFNLASDGSFSYTPNDNSTTTDSFTYRAVRNGILSAPATVTITINQPPVANAACGTIRDNDGSTSVTLTGSDPNGGTLTYSIVSQPTNGTVTSSTPTPNTTGLFTYQPFACSSPPCNPLNRRGMDKYTFRVTDAGGLFSEATAWILNNGKARIMPLGDSITAGVPGLILDQTQYYASYRQKLFIDLNNLSPGRIKFVGSVTTDGTALSQDPPWDIAHEGNEGWCSTEPCSSGGGVAQNIYSWLDNNPGDIVLLHIGTNDLDPTSNNRTDANGVAAILNEIDRWEGDNFPVSVFLAKIIKDVPNYSTELLVSTYNGNLQTMVNGRTSDRIIVVNMENIPTFDYGSGSPGTDMADNLHPTESGYRKMADRWKAALTAPADPAKFLGIPSCP
jgi:hypothetical protein